MPRKSINKKYECHISEKIDKLDKEYIRTKVCQNLQAKYEIDNRHYCLLHYPSAEKVEAFEKEFQKRLDTEDYNFRGVYFPIEIVLFDKDFNKQIDFISATFLKYVRISSAKFTQPIDFIGANFMADVSFYEVIFSQYVSFHAAIFNENSDTSFSKIKFEDEVDFSYANLKGYMTFEGEQDNYLFTGEKTILNLQNARIEKPERILFHSIRLRPSWFVNVDCKNFVFSNCSWRKSNNKYVDAKSELDELIKRRLSKPHRLLRKTGWQLANNHEESKNFYTASLFRQIANESKRLEFFNGFKFYTLHWWYWLSSFYGESWRRAFLVLATIILLIFPFIYTNTNFYVCPLEKTKPQETSACETRPLSFGESVRQSLAMATFQTVETRKPNSPASEIWTILEKIFAPLQAALLALAIRRKFMR